MIDDTLANWTYCEAFQREDDILAGAREAAAEIGCTPIRPGSGALLTVLARAIHARAAVEIGAGAGVSGLYLLRGMDPAGVLTAIDAEAEYHRIAREAFKAEGIAPDRIRMITGEAISILPRLADGHYDMVVIGGTKAEYPAQLDNAVRLLRSGGILAVDNALGDSRVPDPAQRDQDTTAIRETLKAVKGHASLQSVLVPSGEGLCVAVRLGED